MAIAISGDRGKFVVNADHTILLVEDNSKDVFLVQRAFRKADIAASIQVVNDGDAAVLYLSGEPPYQDRLLHPIPALILLDLKLPRRSGAEVLIWLRQQPHIKRIPVVVLTSSREFADVNRVYDLGANAYMVKPPTFDDLVGMIKTLDLHWLQYNEKPQIEAS